MSEDMYKICDMKDKLTNAMSSQLAMGLEGVDTAEAGQVIDMIKDLAQTEAYCRKAEYYKTVVEAMKYEEDYSSKDIRKWYTPITMMDDDMRTRMSREYDPDEYDEHYGRPYNEFKKARKHYTETHSERDKAEMKEHANQHIMNSINSIREIWDASDPDIKQQIRTDLTNMINAMN